MSKVCSICGRKPGFGNNRSHSMAATRRRFDPNLQRMRVLVDGIAQARLRVHPLHQGRQGPQGALGRLARLTCTAASAAAAVERRLDGLGALVAGRAAGPREGLLGRLAT